MAIYKVQPRKTARYFPAQVSLVTAVVYDCTSWNTLDSCYSIAFVCYSVLKW